MEQWTTQRIGDLATVFDGPHATPAKTKSGPWFLSISSLSEGRLDLTESAHVSEADFTKWTRRVTPEEGDLLFSYETRLGAAALMPPGVRGCLGRRMGLLRPHRKRVDERFLLYAYLGPEFQGEIKARAVRGATVDRIPIAEIANWPLRVPPLCHQRAIAEVLGALDDKMAVNERIAETANALAEALYVRDSAIEQGWRMIALSDCAKWLSGGTPKTSEPSYWDGDIPWISAASLKSAWLDDSERKVTRLGAENGTRLVPAGTIIFVVRGMSLTSEFRVGLTQREVAFGQDCKALIPHAGIDSVVLLLALRARTREILGLVDTAGHGTGRLGTDRIAKLRVRLPEGERATAFAETVRPLAQRASAVQNENRTLAALRDTLLPQLVTGKIRVKDAERVVEEATS
ncbi:restriction endonuclease subunit S [Streptomyces sp. NL15-2K]|uniref:restriction endonuclease subunit S n=1 Tax=Streptomyces sp. NL15-2K TaxID=376149 RepID=UPI000FF9458B|nr:MULTISPECIES: restriction endonuclease subunit S [Actinomycetes]WKX11443.1 restriction endonuclease subunit S [Kutzneria buriramensis]GCB47135.1 type I restriction-modification system [Streptomyces sp. NL15-2K]